MATLSDRLNAALHKAKWNGKRFAIAIDADHSIVSRWRNPRINLDPPLAVVEWVERIAVLIEGNPPPTGWKRNTGRDKDITRKERPTA
jgi:hypothetical protein